MSSKSRYVRRDTSLSIEQLEDRNMLSGTSMSDCCETQVQAVQVVECTSAETQAEIQQLAATGVSQVARGLFLDCGCRPFNFRLPSKSALSRTRSICLGQTAFSTESIAMNFQSSKLGNLLPLWNSNPKR